ncbi:MAG TPA: VTC domain-containing protein [Lachnospiraceae bacterium]|nr:VTC domain-containing protein [Lachnospiraceae bacterium]
MFSEDTRFRHEYKYVEPEVRLLAAQKRLEAFMPKDSHVSEKGFYTIRSLYFDDYYDTYIRENIDGVDEREKWRIRAYDHTDSYISLERKSRKSDLISKSACSISRETFEGILRGKIDIKDDNPPLLNVFYFQMRTRLLHPAVIVEYDRTPFAAPQGNTRITFDRNIRSSSELDALLADRALSSRPVLERGQNLLEVKFDDFLPDHIAHTVEYGRMQRETFSKYFLCRRFTYNGISSSLYSIKQKSIKG